MASLEDKLNEMHVDIAQRLTRLETLGTSSKEDLDKHLLWAEVKSAKVDETLAEHTSLINKGKGAFWMGHVIWTIFLAVYCGLKRLVGISH